MTQITHVVDKTGWAAGPWMTEPDRVLWKHAGLDCLIVRAPSHGGLCGYVGVPPGHPDHGKDYGQVDADCHGGLTYAEKCQGPICHTPAPGEPDDIWWFGFDAAHAWDLSPGMRSRLPADYPHGSDDVYRDIAYMTAEVNDLAEQLASRGGQVDVKD